jgi:hypothetical protein
VKGLGVLVLDKRADPKKDDQAVQIVEKVFDDGWNDKRSFRKHTLLSNGSDFCHGIQLSDFLYTLDSEAGFPWLNVNKYSHSLNRVI